MATCSSNNLRSGLKIIFDDEPYTIESSEFVKPGKGQAFVRVKMRRLLTDTRVEKTFKSTDSCEIANVINTGMHYLYNDINFYYFMHPKTFDQCQIEKTTISNVAKWLQNNVEYIITFWNSRPISIQLPNFIEAEVTSTSPGRQAETANASGKSAILSTGATVKVPSFVQIGTIIRVDTRSGEYVARIK
ncbi:elongation factor P [Candidatus Gillettellia adelgis]